MKEIELINKRKLKEKHYLQKDGTIRAEIYKDNIHFFDGKNFLEIDNTLIEKDGYLSNRSNEFKVSFSKNSNSDLFIMEQDSHYINIYLHKNNGVNLMVNNQESKLKRQIIYNDILKDIDLVYDLEPTKVKENILLKTREAISEKIIFFIETDLKLFKNADGSIDFGSDSKKYFTIETPYMTDGLNNYNNNIFYNITRKFNKYELELNLDLNWLNDDERSFPILIDPTITSSSQNTGLSDTYIYPNDTNVNRNGKDFLIAGVNRENGSDIINRTLIKFDLPVIGTGSKIIDAQLVLTGYPVNEVAGAYTYTNLVVHQITSNWEENTASWSNMSDKYNPVVETCFPASRSQMSYDGVIHAQNFNVNLTNLVKKWYEDVPNYGIMIKANKEIYQNQYVPMFFSKDNNVSGANPKPVLVLTYRNQTGLEDYYDYRSHAFKNGASYINTYNGNLVSLFNLLETNNNAFPISLKIVYNTHDVVLNNDYGYGKGWKLNYHQIVKKVVIGNKDYYEFLDSDGTIHYFAQYINEETNESYFKDEDGLGLKMEEDNIKFIIENDRKEVLHFNKVNGIGYLSYCRDVNGIETKIYYSQNNTINKIENNFNSIEIRYNDNQIVVSSSTLNTYINYLDGNLISIEKDNGITNFAYNSSNLIIKILDTNGLSVKYEYYELVPYKIKKVTEYGLSGEAGKYIILEYSYSSTKVSDNTGKTSTIIYNNDGTLLRYCQFSKDDDISDSYGMTNRFGMEEHDKNKLSYIDNLTKSVNNYIENSSFEQDNYQFNNSENIVKSFSEENYISGKRSLKVINNLNNEYIYKEIKVPKDNTYTFSCYLKNDNNVHISLSYTLENGETVKLESETILPTTDFRRHDISLTYSELAVSDLRIEIVSETIGTYYLDDIQLEEGDVANLYNLIDNSNFIYNFSGWDDIDTTKCEIVNLDSKNRALKLKLDPDDGNVFSRKINISGKKGDVLKLSFWYKNNGVLDYYTETQIVANFEYTNLEFGSCCPMILLEPNYGLWQFFTVEFTAKADYNNLELFFMSNRDANELYISNFSLFKGVGSTSYSYDKKGNLINYSSITNSNTKLLYDNNNQLIKVLPEDGKSSVNEFDNEKINLKLSETNSEGVTIENKYDEFNNIVSSITYNKRLGLEVKDDGIYKIRLKGTHKYMRLLNENIIFIENNNNDLWKFNKEGDYFKVSNIYYNNKFLSCLNDKLVMTDFNGDSSLFELCLNDNGSYSIKCIDNKKFLKIDNDIITFNTDKEDYSNQFYIESISNDYFILDECQYYNNDTLIKKTIDSNFNINEYEYYEDKSLKKIINKLGQEISFNYDSQNRISEIFDNKKNIEFEYFKDALSEIICSNKIYKFTYDDFLNLKTMQVNNNTPLITYAYDENNGSVIGYTYANGDNISIEYDSFGRVSNLKRVDTAFQYKYNINNHISKVISNYGEKKFYYDLFKRLIEYIDNDFRALYNYDNNNNLTSKKYSLLSENYIVENKYSSEEAILKSKFDDFNIVYEYDELGKLVNEKIDDRNYKNYKYITNGKRMTNVVKEFSNSFNAYRYDYDKLGNIKNIYIDNKLVSSYKYNQYNEMIEEKDHLKGQLIKYSYDNEGNILDKNVFDLNNFNLIKSNEYSYEDNNWYDKLTKYNNKTIEYDLNGNVIGINNEMNLKWENGRHLKEISFGANTINYKYNEADLRVEKIVNGNKTKYYLDEGKIIFEECNGNIIYYIYDNFNEILGFKYNDITYFYLKNIKDDIIGIMDTSFNIIAYYEYDSWGNIISIKDSNFDDLINNKNHVANINPFRFRSYYYDKETNLYYLNNRYYNPEWGRFISIDNSINISTNLKGYNMYSYAFNNPINFVDNNGNWPSLKSIGKGLKTWGKNVKKSFEKSVSNLCNYVGQEAKKLYNKVTNFLYHQTATSSVTTGSCLGLTFSGGSRVTTSSNSKSNSNYFANVDFKYKSLEGGVIIDKNSNFKITGSTTGEIGLSLDTGGRSRTLGFDTKNKSIFYEISSPGFDYTTNESIEFFGRTDISVITISLIGLPVMVESGATAVGIVSDLMKGTVNNFGRFGEYCYNLTKTLVPKFG